MYKRQLISLVGGAYPTSVAIALISLVGGATSVAIALISLVGGATSVAIALSPLVGSAHPTFFISLDFYGTIAFPKKLIADRQ